jgi:2',3'-cyclic-nucleotide 2'-phosphodiesterase (5'-nucleotidase family)
MIRPLRSLLAAAVLVAATALPALAQNGVVTFLHINDVYEVAPVKGKGGFAPLAALLKREHQRSPNAITTLGGDFLSPSLLSGMDKGSHMVAVLNAVGVDVAGFGNHEFDFGAETAAKRLSESKFPWLATNLRGLDGKPFGGAQDTMIRTVGDIKVGFLGLLTPETTALSSPGRDVLFGNVKAEAARAVAALKAEGANLIVALTHQTLAEDRELAREVKGISLILGGHDHDPIQWYEGSTLIFKSGADLHYLGTVDMAVSTKDEGKGPVTAVEPLGWSLRTTAGVAPDPEIAVVVKSLTDKLDKEMETVLGTAATELDSRRDTVRSMESTMGDLIADALRARLKADAAIVNGGGIRAEALRPAGTVLTRRDVFAELPFGNVGVLVAMKGSDIKAALENGVSQVADKAGRFPQVSGLSFTYDPKAAAGSRVVSVSMGGKPLDLAATYRIATNDFMLKGGDGYTQFAKGTALIDAPGGVLLATIVMDHIEEAKTVAPKVEGRIVEKR